ncbi:MAG: PASTA domain-containing protein [Clostridia bacterium]|nr:PASTA domain-containing protein [Clostridia bacterium]
MVVGVKLEAKALSQWLRDVPTQATRGTITDRYGAVLASSETSFTIYVRPASVISPEKVASVIAKNTALDESEVLEKVNKKGVSEIEIAKNISHEVMQSILKEYEEGIIFAQNSTRNYTYDSLASRVLGFIDADGNGQTGLEAYYNKYLKGVNGVSLVESNLKGQTLENSPTYYIDPIDGLNIELTLDFKIQQAVENIILNAYNDNGAKNASCIVMDPSTGEILALATAPYFNLNEVPRDDVGALMDLSRNIIISDAYEPGSTFKILTTAIALNEGLTSEHDYFYCSGFRVVNGVKINCHRRSGHGSQSLGQGLSNSCNCVFMELARRIGLERFYSYLEKFRLTEGFGLDFFGEGKAVTMPQSLVTDGDLFRMGFGQSIAVTQLGLINSVASCINGGNLMQPYFAKKIYSNAGQILYEKQSTVLNKTVSKEVSDTLNRLLFKVVDGGGGKRAMVAGHNIAGKTGTAQKYENGAIAEGKYVASFIGYAPAENPKYLVLVTVDEPKGAYYGGVVSAPIAKNVFEKIFEIREVEANENLEAGRKALEANIEVPNVIGKTLSQASTMITESGLTYLTSGTGSKVKAQIAEPGSMAFSGDIVLLIMDEI